MIGLIGWETILSQAAFIAYNDHEAGPQTHTHTTTYGANGVSSGLLKDVQTGEWTGVTLSTLQNGVSFESVTGVPAPGTEAAALFEGYVDFSSGRPHSLAVSGGDSYTHRFSGLDPGRRYDFSGTAVRGNDAYTDRWTLVTLNGADSFLPAHSSGQGIVTTDLASNQVALWTGQNHRADQGFVARWKEIDPGSDGVFEIVSSQYQGPTPGVGSGNSSGASKGYALNGIRLAEIFVEGQARVTIEPVSDLTSTTAILRGRVIDPGQSAPSITAYYGPQDGGSATNQWDSRLELGPQTGTFSTVLRQLAPGTRYYFRFYARNSAAQEWVGATQSFVTSPGPPVIRNLEPEMIEGTSARIGFEVTSTGGNAPRVTLYYGEADGSTNATAWNRRFEADIQSGPLHLWIEGLDPEIRYYYRAYATNVAGAAWAEASVSFVTTQIIPPSIELLSPGNLSDISAVIRGRVLDTGGDVPTLTLFFGNRDGGTSTNSWEHFLHLGPQAESFSHFLPGLIPETQYYTRLRAVNRAGAAWTSSALSFKTLPFTPRTVVINEIHYAPASKTSLTEFVELYNTSSNQMDLSGWSFTSGVDYTFPPGSSLAPAQFLVIAQDAGAFRREFGFEPFGQWRAGQRLANEGDPLTLREAGGQVVDEVEYGLAFPWPTRSGGDGPSMELLNPAFDNQLGGSWRPSQARPTPGQRNSVFRDNDLPALRQVKHSPKSPNSTNSVTITVKATDADGLSRLRLSYQVVRPGAYVALDSPGYTQNWTSVPMVDDGSSGDALAGDDLYTAVLPASIQSHRCLVRYRIEAVDTLGQAVTAPYPDDTQPNFAYFVYDRLPAWKASARPGVAPQETYSPELLGSLPVYHLITTRTAHEQSQAIPNSTAGQYWGDEYRWQGALVYDGEVYDHIRFRARGGVWRYSMGKNMWKFDFNRGHDFEARDDYGDRYEVPWKKLNLSALIQQGNFGQRGEQGLFEGAGFRLHNLAANPAPLTHFLHFRIIEHADEQGPTASQFDDDFQGLFMAIEQLDGRFLDQHSLPDGNLYKMEGGSGELNNQGPTQPTNKSDLNAFLSYRQGTRTADWWRQNLDLDQYYSFRAIMLAIHDYDNHAGKNYFYFNHPETGRWAVFNWDLDLTWTTTYGGGGGADPLNSYVLAIPEFTRDFNNRVREIRDLLFNPEQTGMLLDEIAGFIYTPGQLSFADADRAMWDYNPILVSSYVNSSKAGHGRFYEAVPERHFGGMLRFVKEYVATRGRWMDANLLQDEGAIPRTPTITYTGPHGYPLNQLTFNTSAFSSPSGAGFAAMQWRLAWVTDPSSPGFDPSARRRYEITPTWESAELTNFVSSIHIPLTDLKTDRLYRVRVRMKDTAGRWSHWSAPIQFTPAPPSTLGDYQQNLVITEFMYHPMEKTAGEETLGFSNSDFEYLELYNRGPAALDLTPLRFTKGIDFDFTNATQTSIASGQYILIVRHRAAFESRYGPDRPIVAEYGGSEDDKLGNDGEWVKLSYGAGLSVHEWTYSDQAPWPEEADGKGYSVVRRHPHDRQGDLNDPAHWARSRRLGGSPGAAEPAEDSVDAWKEIYFDPQEPGYAIISTDEADPDGDGVPNLLEYFGGTDPRQATSLPALQASLLEEGGGAYLTLRFGRRLELGDLNFILEFSPDLSNWSRLQDFAVLSETPDGEERIIVTIRSPALITAAGAGYLRLGVQRSR